MHRTKTKTIIGTKKSVYRDLPAGKLEYCSLVRTMQIPHQQGFYGNSQAGFTVAVHSLPAFLAFEQGVSGGMPAFSHSTAAATPFTGVVGINDTELNGFIKAPAFEVGFEQAEGHAQCFSVEPSAFGFESFQFFNSNVRIILQRKISDVPDNFSDSIFYEVPLGNPEFHKFFTGIMASLIGETLEDASSFHDFLSFSPDIFSKVKLFQNLSIGSENADGETFAVNVHSDHISSCGNFGFFGKMGDYLAVRSQAVGFASPAPLNKGNIPLIVRVLSDWDCNSFSGVNSEFYKEVAFSVESFSVESFAVSGNIELDGNSFKTAAFGFDCVPLYVAEYLAVERGGFLAC